MSHKADVTGPQDGDRVTDMLPVKAGEERSNKDTMRLVFLQNVSEEVAEGGAPLPPRTPGATTNILPHCFSKSTDPFLYGSKFLNKMKINTYI